LSKSQVLVIFLWTSFLFIILLYLNLETFSLSFYK
jgi:hypothetical protein